MKSMLITVLKWWLIVAFAAVSFYLVCPKYAPSPKNAGVVVNRFTGEVYKGGVKQKKEGWTTKITIRQQGRETTQKQ